MKKAIVFTKNNCTWCDQVKELLSIHGIPTLVLNVEQDETALDLATMVPRKGTTMPQVFEITDTGMTLIGGYEATQSHLDQRVIVGQNQGGEEYFLVYDLLETGSVGVWSVDRANAMTMASADAEAWVKRVEGRNPFQNYTTRPAS